LNAYLLAAGYATRMHPLTRDRPKPLLEVAGRPILSHILDGVLGLDGLRRVVVIANDRFAPHFERWAAGLETAVPVEIVNDGTRSDADKRGALGDLAFALARRPAGDEPWLVAAGDNLLGFPLRQLQEVFARDETQPLLGVRRVKRGAASAYNEVVMDDRGRVERFREKPPDARSEWAAIALYFFPPAVAAELETYLAEGGNPDAPGHFIAWLVDRVPTRATLLPGEWFDIGSLEGLEHARKRYRPPSP